MFGSKNIVVLAPDSRGPTWDMMMEGFGPDVVFLNKAFAHTFERVAIDPKRIALGGFSDGASYAYRTFYPSTDLVALAVEDSGQAENAFFERPILDDPPLARALVALHDLHSLQFQLPDRRKLLRQPNLIVPTWY